MPWFTDIRHRLSRRQDDSAAPPAAHQGAELSMIEPKPVRGDSPVVARPVPEETLLTLQQIGSHMDSQSERAERLLSMLDRMPQAFAQVPELSRQASRLLEMTSQRIAQAREREQVINDILVSIHEDLDGQQTQFIRMAETLDRCEQAMSAVATSNDRGTALLARLADSTEIRNDRIETMTRSARRWMIAGLLTFGTLAAAGLVLGIIAVV